MSYGPISVPARRKPKRDPQIIHTVRNTDGGWRAFGARFYRRAVSAARSWFEPAYHREGGPVKHKRAIACPVCRTAKCQRPGVPAHSILGAERAAS